MPPPRSRALPPSPLRYFNSSPEVIRLVVMIYVHFPPPWRMVVAFRRHTLLPLDDCLYAMRPTISHLTRSALHRCLQRHGISRLTDVAGDKPKR